MRKKIQFICLAFGLYLALTACESTQQYVRSFMHPSTLNQHHFSHILKLGTAQVYIELQPPNTSNVDLQGLTIALHYRINNSEIMTTFLKPGVPGWNFHTRLGQLGPRDQLSYYFSYIYYPKGQSVPFSVDSAWFHHRAPMTQFSRPPLKLQCEVLAQQGKLVKENYLSTAIQCRPSV